jgi:hypothetical protein
VSLLRDLAYAEPERIAAILSHGLESLSIDERRERITGDVRFALKEALERMLAYQESSADAFRGLAYLSEAENDTHNSNNATSVFAAAFR